jgi:hypothetical protein
MSRKAAGPRRGTARQSCGCDFPAAVPDGCRGETVGLAVGVSTPQYPRGH